MIGKLRARDIMLRDVIVAEPDDLVAAANLKMVRANVGGVPVVEGERLVGLITHRDILLAGGEALKLRVRDIMSKELVVVDEDTPIGRISRIMADTGYQRIPVVEDGKLVGLITQSCIIKALADHI
ncbi:CBS domain-containing protein [Methanothermobacter wolfeii]|uniref:CBS domain-containing protein n=1 Tax=Methanothermobacter wolfeii TaxID=145261 RepID=A0A9E7UN74_METWO|nr:MULTISPECIES: CBS domain-containing protein [Methanothermobacter]MDI6701875.1 CBS domain-containing protein [Methanothermobacter wolfeii]MDI6841320.1 CBS domain-containing protein [Methanothermobacter wolfeii]NLM03347.1 CBS domain-containing protein [Methanothermobacter wolfeii]QHN05713.1 CBS domain-containing protein [Methanothermobacter sp. THM-1]UXH31852.1 CBS domain-containing protein [Methanothermobacter wolfeii]